MQKTDTNHKSTIFKHVFSTHVTLRFITFILKARVQ